MFYPCEHVILESQIEKLPDLQVSENPYAFLFDLLYRFPEEDVAVYVKSLTSAHGYFEEVASSMIIPG